MPWAIAQILAVFGRLLLRFAMPLTLAVVFIWLEHAVGVVSWGLAAVLDTVLTLLLEAVGAVDLPDAPAWDSILPASALDLMHLAGLFDALAVFTSALAARIALYLVTLGRY